MKKYVCTKGTKGYSRPIEKAKTEICVGGSTNHISKCCKGKAKTHKGYMKIRIGVGFINGRF